MLQRQEWKDRSRMSARILLAAFGDAGHAFPAISLSLALREAGHEVAVETWQRWREPVEAEGLTFQAAEEYRVFPPPPPGDEAGPAEAARALEPLFEDFRPDLVVSDILTLAPSLAAELHGVPRATLIPHLYPVHQPAMPFFGFGVMPPRSRLGRAVWKAGLPVLESGLRRGRRELNETRRSLGLAEVDRFHGGMSEELVLVATYPELEHPREWPAEVRVTGPLSFEIPHPEIELPPGDEPLVLVASSTAHDPDCHLIRRAFEALAGERVRVVATSNGHFPPEQIEVPANGRLVGWLSYSQLMTAADVVICHGGHGTICRALEAGTPLLVSPAVGDMAENGARVQSAGCGLMLPARFRRPAPLRWCVRELLEDASYRGTAEAIARHWGPNPGAKPAVAAVEQLLATTGA
jgi:UDP:flavonoid glycosyltransferase YjiC (YdhE family)